MGTLYDCLREARLEKYYAAFRANGIVHSHELAHVTMAEFAAMGVSGAEDRHRLADLLNIIKAVNRGRKATSSGDSTTGLAHKQHPNPSSRQSQASSTVQSTRSSHVHSPGEGAAGANPPYFPAEGIRLEPTRNVSVRERGPNFSAASYLDMLGMMSDSSHSDASDHHSQSSDGEPVANHRTFAPAQSSSSKILRKMASASSENVRHSRIKGYNYGVPSSKDSARTRARNSGRGGKVDERIRVCVRKRPQNRREIRCSDEDIVVAESTSAVVVMEPKLALDLTAFTLKHEFVFDEVFDERCCNQDVYIRAARPLISTVFQGSNATFFAYGQTGAGKTHTMMGVPDSPGLYQLAAEDVFSIIASGHHGPSLHVWVSFFEIYCGQLFDLLNRRNRLVAREDGNQRVCIAGLTETEASDVATLIQILDYGSSVRSKGSTAVNPDSSRSHAILQLEIRNAADARLGKISFIDLAGSERASDMLDSDRQTRLEGAEINQSLLALKECIRSIDQETRHTPFRQSKLTHILKDAFIGKSRTCMIANVSPTQSACEHTLNTLRYADRVKQLKKETPNVMSNSVGQAMNLLMNIPLTGPSLFHPAKVLSTSTPLRPHLSRSSYLNHAVDVTLDPAETPIRGHNLHQRTDTTPTRSTSSTSTRASGRRQKKQATAARSSACLRPPWQDVWPSKSGLQVEAAASQAPPPPHPAASTSESDHTDTDSCNITHPTETRPGPSQPNIPVVRSTDTEFEFPTSDFNNIDEQLNDLNQTRDKVMSQQPEGETKPDEGQELSESSSRSELASGNLVEKQKSSDSLTKSSSEAPQSGALAFEHIPTQPSEVQQRMHQKDWAVEVAGPQGIINETPESHAATEKPATLLGPENLVAPSHLTDSFDDEMLFGGPLVSGLAVQETARLNELSARSDQPCLPKTHLQAHKVQEMRLPAVQTAASSELTSFAQRSPMRAELERGARLHHKPVPEKNRKCNSNGIDNLSNAQIMPSTKLADMIDAKGIRGGNNCRGGTRSIQSRFSPVALENLDSASGQIVIPHDHQENVSHESSCALNSQSPSEEWTDVPEVKNWRALTKKTDNSMAPVNSNMGNEKSQLAFVASNVSPETGTQWQQDSQQKPRKSYSDTRELRPQTGSHTGGSANLSTQSMIGIVPPKLPLSAVTTEKLLPGATFSPIHPHPVSTTAGQPVTASVGVVQPKPVTAVPIPLKNGPGSSGAAWMNIEREEARIAMVGHHEDQLAAITSLCKQEMKLLLSAKKLGQKSFDDYLHRVSIILTQKMLAITRLQEEISRYQGKFNSSCTPSSFTAAAASSSVAGNVSGNVSSGSQHS